MWRWLVPIWLTVAAVGCAIWFGEPYRVPPHGEYFPWSVTAAWPALLLLASPTILYYRLLILAGERLFRRRPRTGAALLVLAGAVLPPALLNLWVDQQVAPRRFAAPPAGALTVAVDDGSYAPETLSAGFATCSHDCIELLFSGAARRVITGDDAAPADTAPRRGGDRAEPDRYPTAWALRIERHPVCPPVPAGSDETRDTAFRGGPRLMTFGTGADPNPGDVALARIAAGHCLIAEPASFRDAELRVGERPLGAGGLGETARVPFGPGLFGAGERFVERRAGRRWQRLSQRIDYDYRLRLIPPFALVPQERSLFPVRMEEVLHTRATPGRRWGWTGLDVPPLTATPPAEVRRLLAAALGLPPEAPRDARHQLASLYLVALREREPDAVDRGLLPRLVADPRVAANDLSPLSTLAAAGKLDAATIGQALIARIGRAEGAEIRALARMVRYLTRDRRAALLPATRQVAADPKRAAEAHELFALFEAGDADDARFLLGLFRRDWPAAADGDEAAGQRVAAYLDGLCGLADRSPEIRPALLEASSTALPVDAPAAAALWRTLAGIGVDIARLAGERELPSFDQAKMSGFAHGSRCPRHPRNPPDYRAPPYGLAHGPEDAPIAFAIDLLLVPALLALGTFVLLRLRSVARRAARSAASGAAEQGVRVGHDEQGVGAGQGDQG